MVTANAAPGNADTVAGPDPALLPSGTVDPDDVSDDAIRSVSSEKTAAPARPVPAEVVQPEPAPEAEPAEVEASVEKAEVATVDPDTAPPAILAQGLVKRFGDHSAVSGIDLTVPSGSFFGLVGLNGAGKTTTLSIIAGLLRPDAGEVSIAGIDLRRDSRAAKKMIGVLPDRLRTFDRLTGRQLLQYYGLLRGLRPDVIAERVADLARAFDLTDALGRIVTDYSAGMTKKIMLAGAILHSPRVLILDEPFEAVDPDSAEVILDILRTFVSRGGTVILSSHGLELVERVCTGLAILVRGEVRAQGTLEQVSDGMSLRERFRDLSGGEIELGGLEWLHTSSD